MKPLEGMRGVSLAINAPGPVAAARLRDFGMRFTKVEPPSGDPLQHLGVGWYEELTAGIDVVTIDLKDPAGLAALDALLADARAGRATFKVYRQFKMYNDARFNPALSGQGR